MSNKKQNKKLIIDACIAGSAGTSEHPTSKACRDTLTCIQQHPYTIVMTPDLSAEWKNHQSRFATQWLASMQARRRITRPTIQHNETLRKGLDNLPLTDNQREAIKKDTHLIEAALTTDKTILSSDENARTLFKTASHHINEIGPILWANPTHQDETTCTWLEAGAPPEDHRRLAPTKER